MADATVVRDPNRWLIWGSLPLLAVTLWIGADLLSWYRPLTILVLGSDSRSPGNPARSDTIMVLRADPVSRSLRGLSIPRDLYVPLSGIPVLRKDRINAALFFGDYYCGTKGLEAARETVSDVIGVPIDGVVVVHLDVVKKLVDTLGGVEVYCEKPLVDKKFNSLDGSRTYTLRFESGWNFLNGSRALEFLRTRHVDTDFGRMARNRQFFSAMAARLRSPAGAIRSPKLLPDLWRGVDTDLGALSMLHAAWAFQRCYANDSVRWNAINRQDVLPYVTPKGAQVLVAEPGVLRDAGKTLTGELPESYADAGDDSIAVQ